MFKKDLKIYLIIFFIGLLSFTNNFLNIASPSWYQNYGWDSEQLVLDGIINSNDNEPFKSAALGQFTRPNLENSAQLSRKYFKNKDKSGIFNEYTSQYGLQVKIFSVLVKDLVLYKNSS